MEYQHRPQYAGPRRASVLATGRKDWQFLTFGVDSVRRAPNLPPNYVIAAEIEDFPEIGAIRISSSPPARPRRQILSVCNCDSRPAVFWGKRCNGLTPRDWSEAQRSPCTSWPEI